MSCSTLTTSFSTSTTFHLGSGFWANVPHEIHADALDHHLRRAWQVIEDYQLPAPASQARLEQIVMLAIEADLLFFNAAVFEPCVEDCDMFFAEFLRRALQRLPAYLR